MSFRRIIPQKEALARYQSPAILRKAHVLHNSSGTCLFPADEFCGECLEWTDIGLVVVKTTTFSRYSQDSFDGRGCHQGYGRMAKMVPWMRTFFHILGVPSIDFVR
jgi:hypothetical protein